MRYLSMFALGDQAVSVKLGEQPSPETSRSIRTLQSYLEEHPLPGMIEAVPGLTTIAIYYDPIEVARAAIISDDSTPYHQICMYLERALALIDDEIVLPSRIVEIPVCYGDHYGPDLVEVVKINRLTVEEVIKLHSQVDYTVAILGFSPGFPYLEGMDHRISAPRRASPRIQIATGSVGIAGRQTGVYPIATPGGWNVIGRTPLRLFLPEQQPPTLLRAGDVVRFQPITEAEYLELEGSV